MCRIINAQVLTAEGVLANRSVDCENGRITGISRSRRRGDVDLESCYLLPGFVDIHTHPPVEDAATAELLGSLCNDVRAHGTAGFLFTTGNMPVKGLYMFLRQLRSFLDEIGNDAGCLGIYLEGPYASFEGRGGFQSEAIATPEELPVERLLDACGPWVKYINIAPELPGALAAIRLCRSRGLAVSIGHTRAGRGALVDAVAAGAGSVCHTFNASEIQRFREPGVFDLTVDLLGMSSDALVCELICDGIHVDPRLVQLLYRAKGVDGIALITDSLLGGRTAHEGQMIPGELTAYRVTGGAARNVKGELCGSTLSMAVAVRNFTRFLVEYGEGRVDEEGALCAAACAGARTPARLLGIDSDYGTIEPGRRALFCVLDQDLNVREDLCRRLNAVRG